MTDLYSQNQLISRVVIELDFGVFVITWSPKLSAGEEVRRIYTINGKTNLTDKAWHSHTNSSVRFFKVGVEMQ